MRAILTGATGYIGSNLLKKLILLNWDIAIIKRAVSNIELIKEQIHGIETFDYNGTQESITKAMNKFKPDIVFHLASNVIPRHANNDIEELVRSNITFGIHILEAMRLCGIERIINASSAWQNPEGMGYNPYSLYAALKQSFEDILKFYANVYNIKSISLRLPDTYGPNDNRPKVLNIIKNAAKNGSIIKMSPGDQELDILFINDIVEGFIQASTTIKNTDGNFNVFSLSSRKPIKLKEIVGIFELVNDIKVNIEWGALDYRDNEIMKIKIPDNILPSWYCKIPLEGGLKNFFN